jgi:hypothetical protein
LPNKAFASTPASPSSYSPTASPRPALPDGTLFGEERLAALLRSLAGLDAGTIAGRVERAILDFQEGAPRDDVAVLALRAE